MIDSWSFERTFVGLIFSDFVFKKVCQKYNNLLKTINYIINILIRWKKKKMKEEEGLSIKGSFHEKKL